MKGSKGPLRWTFLAALCITFSVAAAQAQPKKQVKRTTTAAPAQTQPAGEAAVVSRASDFTEPETLPEQTLPERQPVVAGEDETASQTIRELSARIRALETAAKQDDDRKQKRLLLNLDILNRAEQRTEALRKQLYEVIEKESTTRTRLDTIDSDMRPEAIERSVAFAGTLRPEELRALKRKNLEAEKANLQSRLTELQRNKANLEQNLQKADALVEKLRIKLEKEIDDSLQDEPNN
jgi:hypothetical protein